MASSKIFFLRSGTFTKTPSLTSSTTSFVISRAGEGRGGSDCHYALLFPIIHLPLLSSGHRLLHFPGRSQESSFLCFSSAFRVQACATTARQVLYLFISSLCTSHLSPSFLSSLYSQPMTEEGHGFPGAIATSSCESPNMRKPNLGPLGDLPNHSSSLCLFCFDPQNSCQNPWTPH